jgi:predicted transcriptional regulator
MQNKIAIYVRLDAEQHAKLEAWADHIGESQATVVRSALREYFVAHQTDKQMERALAKK